MMYNRYINENISYFFSYLTLYSLSEDNMVISRADNPTMMHRWGLRKCINVKRRRVQAGGSLASFLGLSNMGSRAVNESFDRLENVTPRLIAQIGQELRRSGKVLTDNAINQVIDIPVNRVKGVVRRNITMPISNFRGRINRTITSGANKAKAINKVITGKGIRRRPRRRRQRGGILPILPIIMFLAPFVMSGACNQLFT